MADPPRLARQMQPQHRQPRGCNTSQLGAAVAARRSASQARVVTSQPSPRHKGAWATSHQASAAAAMLRPARRRMGWILAAACLTTGRKRSPEGSRTKKESISATPDLLRCLRPFEILGLLIYTYETKPSRLKITSGGRPLNLVTDCTHRTTLKSYRARAVAVVRALGSPLSPLQGGPGCVPRWGACARGMAQARALRPVRLLTHWLTARATTLT